MRVYVAMPGFHRQTKERSDVGSTSLTIDSGQRNLIYHIH